MTEIQNNNQLLTRTECAVLRGIAIIGIFMHNYCHWLSPIVKENEYTFTKHNVDWFTQVIVSPDWNLPLQLFSFFGHYGVPVFLFLSAYGLVMKYEHSDNTISVLPFVKYHYLKLFKMMIVGFVAFVMIDAITPGQHRYALLDVVGQLFMFNNVLPNPDNIIWPGPYWFFGLMLQLYIIYRLFLYRRHWSVTVAFIIICWLMQVFCTPESETLNRIRYNFMGGMLPFGAGILFARYGRELRKHTYAGITIVSAIAIVACSYIYQAWFFTPLFVCSFSVGIVKLLPHIVNDKLAWMGSISAALFVCHPITRKILIPISRHGDIYTGLLLYIVASIAVAWLFRELMKRIPNPKLKQGE